MGGKRNRARRQAIAEIATAQEGVVSLGQLRRLGLSDGTTGERARTASLHRVHRGVYAVGHRFIGRQGVLRAALLACGDGAVISHGTAAAHWGLRDRFPVQVDVTVPIEAGRKIAGVRCRRCRYPDAEEATVHVGLPCTTPARTLVDEAGRVGADALGRLVERAAVVGLLDLRELDRALARARGRRGVPALRRIVDEWRGAGDSTPELRSVFEARVLPRLLAEGLPLPLCNQAIQLEGVTMLADFFWPDRHFIVETDGRATHETAAAFQRDRRRDQALVAEGYRVFRVTWQQMRVEPAGVVARIRRGLR